MALLMSSPENRAHPRSDLADGSAQSPFQHSHQKPPARTDSQSLPLLSVSSVNMPIAPQAWCARESRLSSSKAEQQPPQAVSEGAHVQQPEPATAHTVKSTQPCSIRRAGHCTPYSTAHAEMQHASDLMPPPHSASSNPRPLSGQEVEMAMHQDLACLAVAASLGRRQTIGSLQSHSVGGPIYTTMPRQKTSAPRRHTSYSLAPPSSREPQLQQLQSGHAPVSTRITNVPLSSSSSSSSSSSCSRICVPARHSHTTTASLTTKQAQLAFQILNGGAMQSTDQE
eukprot:1150778-Pelagomonas_calceolata.AAC.5